MPLITNEKQFNNKLSRAGIELQEVIAESLNYGADYIERKYKENLKKNVKLKNKFSLGSTRTFKANAKRPSGEIRKLEKINAKTGVRQQKGGQKHYLAKMEEGDSQGGNPKTKNRVPVPLEQSRTSSSENKPIAPVNRLLKSEPQTLRIGSKKFGVPGDGIRSVGQRFAILHRYRENGGNLKGNLSKPFYFIGQSRGEGIFRWKSGRFHMMRSLTKDSVKPKKNPQFQKSVDNLTPAKMDGFFRETGNRKLGQIGRG